MIFSKTVILAGGLTFVRKYTGQHTKDPARPHWNRSSFFSRYKHSTPPFLCKKCDRRWNFCQKKTV